MKPVGILAVILMASTTFAAFCWVRNAGSAGPSHDEVITLLASRGLENEFEQLKQRDAPPFHQIVSASAWHRLTRGFVAKSFAAIRDDLQSQDIHPPLAFWIFNRWLSAFRHGGYRQARLATFLQVLVAGGLLCCTILRCTRSTWLAAFALCLFLSGNSAVVTATCVRQYALLALWYAAVLFVAGELSRMSLGRISFALAAAGMAIVCLCGILTQYAFVVMSLPIHVALVVLLVRRQHWSRIGVLLGSYSIAGAAFLILDPGVLANATGVSAGFAGRSQWGEALSDVPQMLIPWASFVPAWICWLTGGAIMVSLLCVAAYVCRSTTDPAASGTTRVLLAGMLGAGVLQFTMVGMGLFPGWATGPTYLCALWLLSVLAIALLVHQRETPRLLRSVVGLGMAGMLSLQLVYGWHCHRIKPHTAPQYIPQLKPDLVLLDNLARGNVLVMTELMNPSDQVLVTDTRRLVQRAASGDLRRFHKVLYLPVQDSLDPRAQETVRAFVDEGWFAQQLPVNHAGFYDAWLLYSPDNRFSRMREKPLTFGRRAIA